MSVVEQKDENLIVDENAENKKLLRKLRLHHILDINAVRVFFVCLFAGVIVSLIPMLRPTYSETEKRELTRFPKFTLNSLLTGDFFDGINLWFADTFPFRDELMTFNGYFTDVFGNTKVQVHGVIEESDEIPDIVESSQTETTTDNASSSSEQSSSDEGSSANSNPSQVTPPPESSVPQIPEYTGPYVEQLGAVLLIDNAAYEYYNFNQELADIYAYHINHATQILEGRAQVHDIIIPTSMAITAPQDIVAGVNTADQKKAIDYMYSKIWPSVNKVDAYKTLLNHKDEYIYFRTDHHWTALGAYYVYDALMASKGTTAAPLSAFIEHQFGGYLGSFYSSSGKKPQLAATPDTVFAYQPTQTNSMTIYPATGGIRENAPIINNGNALGQSSKYLSFICGDHPFSVMVNPQMPNAGACIVVKESFGNAFVPFLTQNYSTVYVVDYRYFMQIDPRRLSDLVNDTGATDVIFINNISATRSRGLVAAIGEFVGQ